MTHENESGEQTVCPECQYPSHAGHMTGCTRSYPVEEAPHGSNEEENFFQLYEGIYNKRKPYNAGTEPHLYVIKNETGEVIAGEVVEIRKGTEAGDEAYFRMKIVKEGLRGKGLMERIEQRAVQTAKAAGCKEGWALAGRDDPPAMRSLMKSGFLIKGRASVRLGEQANEDEYYFSTDLTAEARPVSVQDAMRAKVVQTEGDIAGDALLIPYQNEAMIDIALAQGYVGRQLFLPKEWPETNPQKEVLLYFEKSPPTAQGNPE